MSRSLAVLSVFLFSLSIVAQRPNNSLRDELLGMRDRDQEARKQCANGSVEEQSKCLVKVFEAVDTPHTRRLNEIFETGGFPKGDVVGQDGVKAFYLLLQHSGDLQLKKNCTDGIEQAFKQGTLNASEFTSFVDRLLVDQGKPQIYGSNFESKDGKLVISRTEDVENLDARRKAVGLPPIGEYVKMLKEFYKLEVVLN